ncbi:MAG: acyl-CoA dehydrogenase family protein [Deltaproteobacteria bacterium]|nr:acyl-CoA dehydrogenase family protein [Deltaproteobacteria bacterium]MBW2724673.1 acyl-CoA dehydrogenase family protein [Deltaproteobacteria bacterium]
MTDEIEAIYQQTIEFVAKEVKPKGLEWEEEGKVPREILHRLGGLGMLSLRIPEELGGVGLGPIASAAFSEALGSSTFAGFDVTVLVHTDMAGPHLVNSGSPEQLERWMPGVLSGETILSIAVSEPAAGSDVAGIRATAKREGDGWVLNGQKTFITNAVYGDMTIIAARTKPEDKYGISMFLVPKDTEGFQVSKKLDKHGWRCSDTAELTLDNVYIPDDQLLGTPHRGFYETMKNFQNERMVLVGMGVGSAQAAIDMTIEYTQERPAFGGRLFDLGAIRQRMAMNQAKVDAVRASMYHAAWLGEQGQDNIKEMSGVKAWGCEVVNQVMYDCTQFHGGMGFMRESAIERMYRDARVLTIGGGATEVMLEEVAKRAGKS